MLRKGAECHLHIKDIKKIIFQPFDFLVKMNLVLKVQAEAVDTGQYF